MQEVKQRNVALAVIFTLITCGIYGIYWQVCLVNDINRISGEKNAPNGIVVMLLSIVTCGIYWFYWVFKAGDQIDKAKSQKGEQSSNRGILFLILTLFALGIVTDAIMQSDINSFATTE